MKTLRFYKIAVFALLLLNAVTLFFLWKGAKHHGPPDRNELIEHLGFEGKIKEKILRLQDEHFKLKNELIDRSRVMHEQLLTYFSHPTENDHAVVTKKINQLVENQREIEQMTYDYFREVSKYCNKDQKKRLSDLIHDALHHAPGPPKR